MDFAKLKQIQLSDDTEIKPFRCAEDNLNGFLFDDAKHFQKELMRPDISNKHCIDACDCNFMK